MIEQNFVKIFSTRLLEFKVHNDYKKILAREKYIYYALISVLTISVLIGLLVQSQLIVISSVVLAILVLIIWALTIWTSKKRHHLLFKRLLITACAKAMNPTVVFKSNEFIHKEQLERSGLFDQLKGINGADYFKGTTGNGYPFEFSEIKLMENENGATKEEKLTFRGVFFVLESPTELVDQVLFLPPTASSKLKKNRIKFTNEFTELEKYYTVYSKKKEDVKKVLSTGFMTLITQLAISLKGNLQIAVVKDKVYIILSPSINYSASLKTLRADIKPNVGLVYGQLKKSLNIVENISRGLEEINPKDWDDTVYDHFIDNEC